jgi:tetratricopeptide (TPR) repeat protein
MVRSPYADRLLLAIEKADDPAVRASRRAELAACLARHGEFDAAEPLISELRAEYGDGRSGRVTIMIMCAEAQLIYFKSLGDQARDRMMRAQLLSVAGRDAALTALTSAWLAHINFNLHRHSEMARCVKTALDTVSANDHEALARLALTLGDAFYAADQQDLGSRWYAKAHEYAVKLGDHSTIGALTYNRAAMGTFLARLAVALGEPIADGTAERLAGEVRTAINYQAIAQLTSLQPLLDHTLASVNLLTGRYAEALEPLSKLVAAHTSTSPMERYPVIECDLALCMAKLGRLGEAEARISQVAPEQIGRCTPDDQVVALRALAGAARLCGLDGRASEAEAALQAAREDHRKAVADLRAQLVQFTEVPSM